MDRKDIEDAVDGIFVTATDTAMPVESRMPFEAVLTILENRIETHKQAKAIDNALMDWRKREQRRANGEVLDDNAGVPTSDLGEVLDRLLRRAGE